MGIEYDPRKDIQNQKKHGFPLVFAARVLNDPLRLTFADQRETYGEDRWVTYGQVDGVVFVTVWTRRNTNIRIISVRKGNKREQKKYLQNKG